MDYERLESLILEYEPDSIFTDDDGINVTTEWLVGTFAGRGFVSDDKTDAMNQMCDYFDENKGHDSIVGRIVTNSGWPNLDMVERYLQRFKNTEKN